jgi:hypothetical protein
VIVREVSVLMVDDRIDIVSVCGSFRELRTAGAAFEARDGIEGPAG